MEQKLKNRLREESRYDDKLKDEIWSQIELQLEGSPRTQDTIGTQAWEKPRMNNKGRTSRMKAIKIWTGVAAAAIAVAVFLTLPPGTAMMKSIQNWFAPEKEIEIEVEGQKEQTQGQVHVDEASRYAIYYDKERYKLVQEDGKDVITTIDPLPEPYPQVSLTIEQNLSKKPEELAQEIAEQLAKEYAEVREIEQVTSPVNGYSIHAIDGSDRLSKVITVYVTSNEQQGSFILTSRYFLEAAEGHGARFTQTLEQFEVLKPE
ncbi:hypothetical protein D3P08_23185 [Paenibacillus nanensis]|uniref:Uncharacterized protein n=1 Tax=Paenibacillus nanensis TaxID=393251 RepID=A0A3A1UTW3_9BACL|nr:hypothetical protein [Paenibacillus nanensis]RIX49244.1 hypothetical protein D3P08_23185 [Paenibacillus nanensis]